jgi:hypothetical protein
METIAALAARKLSKFLVKDFRESFGCDHDETAELLGALALSAIECIGKSDCLYHNFEHTMLVTLVGREILRGRMVLERVEPQDYSHLIAACLLHDIGFVRGILSGDSKSEFVVDLSGRKVTLPRGASDASLTVYHVDRSKMFAFERLGNSPVLDAARVAQAIELTRFPPAVETANTTALEPRLVQAADLVGQLGDPFYPKKANALYRELEEAGKSRQLGYSCPADLIEKYPQFYWNHVSSHIEEGKKYLSLTDSGRQWIANLNHHLYCSEISTRSNNVASATTPAAAQVDDRARTIAGRAVKVVEGTSRTTSAVTA